MTKSVKMSSKNPGFPHYNIEQFLYVAPSHKREVKSAASRLTLTVVVELLNAAPAASTVRVILPSVLFLRATRFYFNIYNAEALAKVCSNSADIKVFRNFRKFYFKRF